MSIEKIGGYKIEFFESIEELPAKRFHKFNKYLLIDSGIGGDINDVSQHLSKIEAFINKGEKEKALKQVKNLRQCFYQVAEELHVGHLSLIILIKTINGKPLNDLSDENVRRLSDKLLNAKKSFLEKLIDRLKKKIDDDLKEYFPEHSSNVRELEFTGQLRSRTLLLLDSIIKGQDNSEKIKKVELGILTMVNPLSFQGKGNAIVKHEKQFQEMLVILKDGINFEVTDNTTVLEMFTALERLKKKFKPQKDGRRQPAKV